MLVKSTAPEQVQAPATTSMEPGEVRSQSERPSPAGTVLDLQKRAGNRATRSFVEETRSRIDPLPRTGLFRRLIVDDETVELEAGQMRKSDFFRRLRRGVRQAADEGLAGTGRNSRGCPWIELSLRFYSSRDAARIERELLDYAPEALRARAASDYVSIVAKRVRRGVRTWVETGELTAVPRGLPGQGLIAALSGAPASGAGNRGAGGPSVGKKPRAVRQRLGEGRPLDPGVRSRMESALGRSLRQVRVHTGDAAAREAARQRARAFSIGSSIAFAAGQYRPGTLYGDGLIAHELAHVAQHRQSREEPPGASGRTSSLEADANRVTLGLMAKVWAGVRLAGAALSPSLTTGLSLQRCSPFDAGDFQVRGKLNRPNDLRNIYFEQRGVSLDSVELEKIPRIIDRFGQDTNLTLNGFRSGDEPSDLASQRVDAVWAQLGHERSEPPAHPAHTGERARVPKPDSGASRIDYRSVRKVEVLETPSGERSAPSREPECEVGSLVECPDEPNAFTDALPVAEAWVTQAIAALEPATLNDDDSPTAQATRALLRDLFGGTADDADVRMQTGRGHAPVIRSHLNNLLTQLGRLPAQHECHNRCNAACSGGRAAKNTGTGTDSLMTLCLENFFSRNIDSDAATLVHESAHATTGLATADLAYASERRIRFLPDSEALRNTDSYVLLVRLIANPGSVTIGPSEDDTIGGLDEIEEQKARVALAWLEKWLRTASFDTQLLFDTINRSVPLRRWAARDGDAFNRGTMQHLAPLFELTEPGTGPDFTPPTGGDQLRVAAIYDRYERMARVVRGEPVNVTKTVGDSSWMRGSGEAGALAGNLVSLDQDFFALPDEKSRVLELVELLAKSTPGVSEGAVPRYVEGADRMRRHRRLGPS